jgi:hypothetical protein
MSYGNEKPPLLQAAEKSIWATLFRIASGLNSRDEIARLVKQLDELGNTAGISQEEGWFVQGAVKIISSSCYFLISSCLHKLCQAQACYPTSSRRRQ